MGLDQTFHGLEGWIRRIAKDMQGKGSVTVPSPQGCRMSLGQILDHFQGRFRRSTQAVQGKKSVAVAGAKRSIPIIRLNKILDLSQRRTRLTGQVDGKRPFLVGDVECCGVLLHEILNHWERSRFANSNVQRQITIVVSFTNGVRILLHKVSQQGQTDDRWSLLPICSTTLAIGVLSLFENCEESSTTLTRKDLFSIVLEQKFGDNGVVVTV